MDTDLSLEKFGTLGFWREEDAAPLRGEGNSAKPAAVTYIGYSRNPDWEQEHLETIKKESTTEELVGHDELEENNGKVEELTEDETVEVDVVPGWHHCNDKIWRTEKIDMPLKAYLYYALVFSELPSFSYHDNLLGKV